MLTFIQIYSIFKEAVEWAANIKELSDVGRQFEGINPTRIFLASVEEILDQEQKVFKEKGKNFYFQENLDYFESRLSQNSIIIENLPISPEILYDNIGTKIMELLLDVKFIGGMDIGFDIDEDWAERVSRAICSNYANNIYEKLFTNAIRQDLQFVLDKVKNNDELHKKLMMSLSYLKQLSHKFPITKY